MVKQSFWCLNNHSTSNHCKDIQRAKHRTLFNVILTDNNSNLIYQLFTSVYMMTLRIWLHLVLVY